MNIVLIDQQQKSQITQIREQGLASHEGGVKLHIIMIKPQRLMAGTKQQRISCGLPIDYCMTRQRTFSAREEPGNWKYPLMFEAIIKLFGWYQFYS